MSLLRDMLWGGQVIRHLPALGPALLPQRMGGVRQWPGRLQVLQLAGRTQTSLEEMPRPGQTSGNTRGCEQGGVELTKMQAKEAQGLKLGCGSSFSPRPPQAVFLPL